MPVIEQITPQWDASRGVRAFTTTRHGGASAGVWRSLNLGDDCGDRPEAVASNRARLREALPDEPGWIAQVHGIKVVRREAMGDSRPEADAVVCHQPGLPCTVLTADCLPVVFCDRESSCVAVAHAGWRGLAAGVLEETIKALAVEPDRLLAWLGPGISKAAFEIGPEVQSRFDKAYPGLSGAFDKRRGNLYCDLYAIARHALRLQGISAVTGGKHCTYTEQERFFSYRRDGQTGRMATTVWFGHLDS